MAKASKAGAQPTGITEIDALALAEKVTVHDYVAAASAYVRQQSTLAAGPKKASQIRLSNILARALADELQEALPQLRGHVVTQERKVAGGLRSENADVSQIHPLDGLRLAVEIKPINLAVGRAIWNRFGDIRTFAVNIHLKFRFAVVGGVLAIPTYEEVGTKAAKEAETEEIAAENGEITVDPGSPLEGSGGAMSTSGNRDRKPTVHLINRAVERLVRAGGRKSEAEADHLLEGIAVVVYDPDSGTLSPDSPPIGSGLRWEEFVGNLVAAYKARFED